MNTIDNFLNRITMYRLVLYYLIILWAVALIFSFFGSLPFSSLGLFFSTFVILVICWLTNRLFALVFEAHTNIESFYITAFILALVIQPPSVQPFEWSVLPFLVWVPIWAMASKYIFALGEKHIFNPAAFGVMLGSFTLGQSATWWIGGNIVLLSFVVLGGLLIMRKLQREDLVLSFFAAAALSIILTNISGENPGYALQKAVLHSPIFFFAFVMLTEPLTTPPTRMLRVPYGILVGLLFAPLVHFGAYYSTPELSLLIGNLFSYAVSPKWKHMLSLVEKREIGADIYEFIFATKRKLHFAPGQYLEWTLGHAHSDTRGNRRYFTVASSPTEDTIRTGIKFYPNSSTYKESLKKLNVGDTIAAAQLAGDFTMPKDKNEKLVFIAGGIGVTPFRSMIKYLLDRSEMRDIVLFYAAKTPAELAYADIFEEARRKINLKPIYVVEQEGTSKVSLDHVGRIDAELIKREVPDYKERIFYISGPRSLITVFEKVLGSMGVSGQRIKTDFFPGFA
jgi:ferredoxin-NADP reductase